MKLNRRDFLQVMGSGVVAMSAPPLLSGCSGQVRAGLPTMRAATELSTGLDETGYRILHYASLAPSGHNTQPWIVKVIDRDHWIIVLDHERRLPNIDPNNHESFLSLGTFTENLMQAVRAFGRRAELSVVARDNEAHEVTRVTLVSGPKGNASVLERMKRRRVLKSEYFSQEIKAVDIDKLAAYWPGHLHYFPRGTQHAKCIAEASVEGMRIQCARDVAMAENARWMRFSSTDARRYRDGLTTEGMEITGFAGWFVRHFMTPEKSKSESWRKQTIDHTAKQASEGGGWIVLTSQSNNVVEWIEAGRRFQRMSLILRDLGIAIHPMSQSIEENTWSAARQGHGGVAAQFCLRVGYVKKYPEPVSLRRPVEWFVKQA